MTKKQHKIIRQEVTKLLEHYGVRNYLICIEDTTESSIRVSSSINKADISILPILHNVIAHALSEHA